MLKNTIRNIKNLIPFIIAVNLGPVVLLLAVAAGSMITGITLGDFTRDPASINEMHPFIGVVSNAGILLWTACACVCLVFRTLLRRHPGREEMASFLLYMGLATLLLMLDDLLLLHELIFPEWIGIPEKAVMAAYGMMMAFGIIRYRSCILKTEYLLLLIALGCFAASVAIDILHHPIQLAIGGGTCLLLEDGFKLLGIAGWFGYFLRTGLDALRIPEPPNSASA